MFRRAAMYLTAVCLPTTDTVSSELHVQQEVYRANANGNLILSIRYITKTGYEISEMNHTDRQNLLLPYSFNAPRKK